MHTIYPRGRRVIYSSVSVDEDSESNRSDKIMLIAASGDCVLRCCSMIVSGIG